MIIILQKITFIIQMDFGGSNPLTIDRLFIKAYTTEAHTRQGFS